MISPAFHALEIADQVGLPQGPKKNLVAALSWLIQQAAIPMSPISSRTTLATSFQKAEPSQDEPDRRSLPLVLPPPQRDALY